ncbi:MAG: hypothetical protein R6W93_05735 [Candidatus Limnocylindrales bacterium]
MRVLLVKPKARLRTILGLEAFQRLEPIELGYIAAVVRDPHTARVLDLRLARRPVRAFRDCLHRFRPNVVGFTSYTHEASLVKQMAHLTRDCLPDAFVSTGIRKAVRGLPPQPLGLSQEIACHRSPGMVFIARPGHARSRFGVTSKRLTCGEPRFTLDWMKDG